LAQQPGAARYGPYDMGTKGELRREEKRRRKERRRRR
jgi:hypothetical protein